MANAGSLGPAFAMFIGDSRRIVGSGADGCNAWSRLHVASVNKDPPTMLPRPGPLTLLLFGLPMLGVAQRSGIGIKGGLLAATTTAKHIETTVVPGATAGIYAPFQAGNRLELQPELLFTVLGSGFVEPNGDRTSLRTMMVQVPLSAKLFLNNTFNVLGGFQLGKVVNAQRIDPEGSTDVTDELRPMDLGANIGIGLDLSSGWDLGLRYYSGLWTILEEDDALFPRNRTLQFTAGKRLMRLNSFAKPRRRR